jgi:hypothetical protein
MQHNRYITEENALFFFIIFYKEKIIERKTKSLKYHYNFGSNGYEF